MFGPFGKTADEKESEREKTNYRSIFSDLLRDVVRHRMPKFFPGAPQWCWMCACVNIHVLITTTRQSTFELGLLCFEIYQFRSSLRCFQFTWNCINYNSQLTSNRTHSRFAPRHTSQKEEKRKACRAARATAEDWVWQKWKRNLVFVLALCAVSSWFMNRKSASFPTTEYIDWPVLSEEK